MNKGYQGSSQYTKPLYEAPTEDIVDLLKREGYEVIEGAEAVREAIRRSTVGEGVYG